MAYYGPNFEPMAWNNYRKEIPDRPLNPAEYPIDDVMHWYVSNGELPIFAIMVSVIKW